MKSSRLVAIATGVALGWLALMATTTYGYVVHEFESEITEVPAVGPPPQDQQVPQPGRFGRIDAMTVDSSHLYTAENARVDEFSLPTNSFIAQLQNPETLGGFGSGVVIQHISGKSFTFLGVDSPATGLAAYSEGSCQTIECVNAIGEEWLGAHTPNESFVSEKGEGIGVLRTVTSDTSTGPGDWASGDVFILTRSEYRGQFPNLNAVTVFNPGEASSEGSEPPKAATELVGTPAEGAIGSTDESERFEEPVSVAVSGSNGEVAVIDNRASGPVVDLFQPAGLNEYAFAGYLTPPGGSFGQGELTTLAIDGGNDGSPADGDIYVVKHITLEGARGATTVSVIYEFNSQGEYIGSINGREPTAEEPGEEARPGEFQYITSLAVDAESHRLYIGDYAESGDDAGFGLIEVFGPDETLPAVSTAGPPVLHVEKATHTWSAELGGTVNPEGAGSVTCDFAWGNSPSLGQIVPCNGSGENSVNSIPNGTVPIGVHSNLPGLAPGTTYYYRLQARNSHGLNPGEESQTISFLTAGPTFGGTSVSHVSTTTATLGSLISPNGYPTAYRFDYATEPYTNGEASNGKSVPSMPANIGSGSLAVEVTQVAHGLQPNTTYHYRLVAIIELTPGIFEEFDGPERVFKTDAASEVATLLDARRWELVSPADKHGALVFGLQKTHRAPAQASLDGTGVTYSAFTPTELSPPGYTTSEQIVSRRNSDGGWTSRDISPPHGAPVGAGVVSAEFLAFDDRLSQGLLQLFPIDKTLLSSDASEETPYLTHVECIYPSACYVPLATNKPGGDVPPGIVFGGRVGVVGMSEDLQHVILRSGVQLTSIFTGENQQELYEWSDGANGGTLELISQLPMSEGGGPLSGGASLDLGNEPSEKISSGVNPVSRDGGHVFWSTGEALFMHDSVNHETIRLDVPQSGISGGEAKPLFETASADGSVALFTDRQRLTADASKHGADLYECVVSANNGRDSCVLRDLTPEVHPGSSEVQNLVLGASEDDSSVYFVANGVLGDTPPWVTRGSCREGSTAVVKCNLYAEHDGKIQFVARVSSEDELDWGGEFGIYHTIGFQTARVSGNGRFAAFMSVEPLTGYDNHDVRSGEPDTEVFEYDAELRTLTCASCNPAGAQPIGEALSSLRSEGAPNLIAASAGVGMAYKVSNVWISANLPTGVAVGDFTEALYMPRLLSDSGRLFFNSRDALVPTDANGEADVYEFEPTGSGTCNANAAAFVVQEGGCIALISSGTSSSESAVIDASKSGNDVFFITSEALVKDDRDRALDVYDAHTCTADAACQEEPSTPSACTTADACRARASSSPPTVFATPRTEASAADGNWPLARTQKKLTLTRSQKLERAFEACNKRFRSKMRRLACKRRARNRYQAKRHRLHVATREGLR